jgi:hypothetical protein
VIKEVLRGGDMREIINIYEKNSGNYLSYNACSSSSAINIITSVIRNL